MRKLLILLGGCLFYSTTYGQFNPDQTKNFWVESARWNTYYESLKKANQLDDDERKGHEDVYNEDEESGYEQYMSWKSFWTRYMPANGSYDDARKVYLELQSLQDAQASAHSGTSRISTVWTEVGPKKYSDMQMPVSSVWTNPHVNGSTTIRFDASCGRFDRIYRHPVNANTLFACAGNRESAGGGLFISTDYGVSWNVAGTDAIPNPSVMCFGVKPSTVSPYPGTEIWFIGLVSGSVYRSMDQGATWVRINNYVSSTSGIDSFTDYNNNITYDSYTHNIIFIPDATNTYGIAVVAGLNGLYYSTNFGAATASTVVWNKFNLTMPPDYATGTDPTKTIYTMTDVEYYNYGGNINLVANMVKQERNSSYTNLGYRNYVMKASFPANNTSSANLQVLGGNTSGPNSQFNVSTNLPDQRFHSANLEVLTNSPNYIYASYFSGILGTAATAVIYRYDLVAATWTSLNSTGLSNNGVYNEPHCLAIDPADDHNYFVLTNHDRHYVGTTPVLSVNDYGARKHSDTRDVFIDYVGTQRVVWVATDGGIYKSTNDAATYTPMSDGLNTAETERVTLAQQAPYYVTAAAWHGGGMMLDPASQKWHTWEMGDGHFSHTTFLNPNKVYFWDQVVSGSVNPSGYNYTTYILSSSSNYGVSIASSENVPGLAYSGSGSTLLKTTNDFTSTSSLTITGYNSPVNPNRFPGLYIVPNDPDRLVVVDSYSVQVPETSATVHDRIVYLKNMSTTPVIDFSVNIDLINTNTATNVAADFDYGAGLVLDPLNPDKFYLIYRGYPTSPGDELNRIVQYDRATASFTDITYRVETFTNFPYFIPITNIEMDRQTGVLYLGTANGVYYLDKSNPFDIQWRKYSTNVPYYNSSLSVLHCSGEIYASTSYRGIWKAPLMRTGVVGATQEWHITQSATWTDRKNLFCTMVVDPGVTLTIKSDLKVYGNQSILVKKGGTLVLDGGRITTECGDMWNGVFVEGTYNAPQTVTTSTQGKMLLINGATIENSYNGIANYGVDANWNVDWSKTGGIIDASNSFFKNNGRAAEFQTYPYGPCISKFNTCTFQTTQLLNDQVTYPGNNGIEAFVTASSVNGILFEGNTFTNTFGTGLVGANFGKGIGASECVFTVQANSSSVGNTFHNLFRGVELSRTSAATGTLTIQNNTFDNNRTGIYLIGNSISNEITNNTFTKTGLPPYTTSNAYYGILLDATRDFNIVNNTFTNFNFGCYIKNSSISTDPDCNIYANTFTDNFRSITSQYNNSKLNIKCNTFRNTNSVAQMYWLNYNTIPNQGSCTSSTSPAGNLFYDPIPVEKDIHNYNATASPFTYSYHGNPGIYLLSDIVPNIYVPSATVTLTPCSAYTFNPAVTCNYVLPIMAPINNARQHIETEINQGNYTGALDKMAQAKDELTASELSYYSVIIPMLQKRLAPPQLSQGELNLLHGLALVDSSEVGANSRGIFTFFFKEEFENYMPEIIPGIEYNPAKQDDYALLNQPILFQNRPNPMEEYTEIRAYLPGKNGILEIVNVFGQLVKTYTLQEQLSSIMIRRKELEAGTYFYSLKIDGRIVDTKKMVTMW